MGIPAVVCGTDSRSALNAPSDVRSRLSVPDLDATLSQANRMAGSMTLLPNKAEADMKELAGKVDAYYRSPEFQGKLQKESQRIRSELFGDASARFYPDNTASPPVRGKLGSDERIYLFISSSMPLQTVRNYVVSVARLGDPNIILVMRGFIEGMTKIQPTISFIGTVLQRDPSCNPLEGECEMLSVALVVDPLLFRRYGIDRVPAMVYARGVIMEDSGLSEGDPKNTSSADLYTVYGDASLEYLIEQIWRETGSRALKELSGR
jgi:type-F conjugative transfer system pilin assembly protein TrbC